MDLFEPRPTATPPPTPTAPATDKIVVELKKRKRARKKQKKEEAPDGEKGKKQRGDTPALKAWRTYFQEWLARHKGDLAGVTQKDKAKLAGIAYRHANGKRRESDPLKPEWP